MSHVLSIRPLIHSAHHPCRHLAASPGRQTVNHIHPIAIDRSLIDLDRPQVIQLQHLSTLDRFLKSRREPPFTPSLAKSKNTPPICDNKSEICDTNEPGNATPESIQPIDNKQQPIILASNSAAQKKSLSSQIHAPALATVRCVPGRSVARHVR
jgi:hypothetical protein